MDSPEPRISGLADAASSGAGTVSQVPSRSSAHEVRHLSLTPWQLLLPLFAFEGFLLAMHAFVHTAPAPWDNLQIWFDLGAEGTVPAWFSSGQFLLVGLALLAAAALRRGVSPSEMRLLLVAGLGFIFLSADEAAMIHERITRTSVPTKLCPVSRAIVAYGFSSMVQLVWCCSRSSFGASRDLSGASRGSHS